VDGPAHAPPGRRAGGTVLLRSFLAQLGGGDDAGHGYHSRAAAWGQCGSRELTIVMAPIVYVVTCGQCGRTWQRRNLADGQQLECIVCGFRGWLSVGALPVGDVQRAEARLVR